MESKRMLIDKKIALSKVKRTIKDFSALNLINTIEADSAEIVNYREQIKEMNNYSYPKLAVRKLDKNNDIMVEWFFQEITFLKGNTTWIIPFDERGIWWIKAEVINYREAIKQLWNIGEFCIIEQETKMCFYVQIEEDNCNLVFKQLQ